MGDLSRLSAAAVRGLVAAMMPDYEARSVAELGQGQDNIAYEVNHELIVRLSKDSNPLRRAQRVDRESRLLTTVAGVSAVSVPKPVFTVAGQGCIAYFKLPGVPLLEIPQPQRLVHCKGIAATLGKLLTALHAVPLDRLTNLVGRDNDPPAQWLREAAEIYAMVAGEVPGRHRAAVEAFFAAPPPVEGYAPAFSHNDLGIEHVLIQPSSGRVTGIIDWSDAAIADPAYDFGLLYRDLGPTGLDVALGGYQTDVNDLVALADRAKFYARCSVFEDLAHGIGKGQDNYVDMSLTAMGWLFPA